MSTSSNEPITLKDGTTIRIHRNRYLYRKSGEDEWRVQSTNDSQAIFDTIVSDRAENEALKKRIETLEIELANEVEENQGLNGDIAAYEEENDQLKRQLAGPTNQSRAGEETNV